MEHWNGDIPVAATGKELWAYSVQDNCWLQELGLWMQAAESLFQNLVCPLGLPIGLRVKT